MKSVATSKSTKKPITGKVKAVSKVAKSSSKAAAPKPKAKTAAVTRAERDAARSAIPVMADTGKKVAGGGLADLMADMPVNLTRRNKGYSPNSHRTKDRIPLQISLPPKLVHQMKAVKLLKGVSMVDQIIHCMEAAGYEVDESAKEAMSKRYSSD